VVARVAGVALLEDAAAAEEEVLGKTILAMASERCFIHAIDAPQEQGFAQLS
jgi:hypothetical protein